MKKVLIAGRACVVVIVLFLTMPFIAPIERSASQSLSAERPEITLEGVLLRDGKYLKPGVWYLGHEDQGEKIATELAFSPESVCAGKTRSGICNPDRFIVGRRAHVEGGLQEDTVSVQILQFLDPIATSTSKNL